MYLRKYLLLRYENVLGHAALFLSPFIPFTDLILLDVEYF